MGSYDYDKKKKHVDMGLVWKHITKRYILPIILIYLALHILLYLYSLNSVTEHRTDFSNLKLGPLLKKKGHIVKKKNGVLQGVAFGMPNFGKKMKEEKPLPKVDPPPIGYQELPKIDTEREQLVLNLAKELLNGGVDANFIYFMFVNNAYQTLTLNWLCNVAIFPKLHDKILIVSMESNLCDAVALEWDNAVSCVVLKIDGFEEGYDWGMKKYINILTMRAHFMNLLANNDIPFVLVESDAVWFKDPQELIASRLKIEDADIIVPEKKEAYKGDSLTYDPMVVIPTNASKHLFKEMVKKLEAEPTLYDQDLLNEFCAAQVHGVVCRTFDYAQISDGKWFEMADEKRIQTKPYIVNNNYYIGVRHKETRQAMHGFWFLNVKSKHCQKDKVQLAVKKQLGLV